MSDTPQSAGTVLIVEDNPNNIKVLGTMLMEASYRVAVANRGSAVFELIPKVKPDLILLDIMMPEMDGYEVCRLLKASSVTQDIPIIFLSAKNETDDIVKGFDLGGADYVTKPFRSKELLARVHTQIALIRLQRTMNKKNQDLEEALANVKTLSGLLPICAWCKKIRKDDGYWQQIEAYLHDQTKVDFTHSVCPECSKKHFSKG